ncbi:Rieske 2Fe-2S domain-containing protein [Stagnihabitans tardus]|uniref:Rieske 2Fe-2S domain-containing protein n=1 Tax=Stagnihabitans tardus TaxID=2699202 RepID=A0AAE4YGQ8_9RHOB|nr:Rieske 2Fe-2S domain-containing protein [Stagnihabitans tardus]NBZ89834.1 Rieske 2Fe-2S domain-containing protein [Stagnihabitans tardus]
MWLDTGPADLAPEEGRRFDQGARTFAIFRNHEDGYFATDGLCTHEDVHLCDGLVVENTVECPKHSSIFNLQTGEVETPPACNNLRTYPAKVEAGRIWIEV